MHPNDADRMANSVGPDQTAPLGDGFAQTYMYMSENFRTSRSAL